MSPQLPQNVNTDEHEDSNFDALPAGWYTALILNSELRTSNAGDQALNFEFEITGPTHAGRRVFNWMNLYHSKEKVRNIAQREFSTMCRAVGINGNVDDSDVLHGRELRLRLAVSHSEKYGEGNDVKGFKPLEGGASVAPGQGSQPWEQVEQQSQAPASAPPQAAQPAAQPAQAEAPAPAEQAQPAPAQPATPPAPAAPSAPSVGSPPWMK